MAQVDNRVVESILNSFARGRAEAFARMELAQRQEKESEEAAFRQQQADEAKRQFDLQLKEEQKQNQLLADRARIEEELAVLAGTKQIKELIDQGVRPPGYKDITPVINPQIQELLELTGQPATQRYELLERERPSRILPERLTVETPEFRRETAAREETLKERRKKELDLEFEKESAKIVSAETEMRLKQEADLARERMANDLEIAQIRAAESAGAGKPTSGLAQAVINNPRLLWQQDAMTPSQRASVLGELSLLGYNPLAGVQEIMQSTATTALNIINEIEKDEDFVSGGAAYIESELPGAAAFFPKAFASRRQLDRLVNILAVPELEAITLYPISENDREFLKSIATYLHLGLDDKPMEKELKRLKTLLETIQKTPLQSTTVPRITPNNPASPRSTIEGFDRNR